MKPAISIQGVSKSYSSRGKHTQVLKDFTLEVKEGEFICFFGPNGCGKSTLLYMMAGLERFEGGAIEINGKPLNQAKAGFVFQDYTSSLFPWRTVKSNVEYALECAGSKEKALPFLKKVGLADQTEKFPYELSGGMRQRVAIARALAFHPDVLLLDEPFSALDFETRLSMEEELLKVWTENRITTICVSHDVDEAVFLADKVVVLSHRPGKVKGIVEVKLKRPRNMATRTSKEFYELRNEVIEFFRG